MSLEAAFDRDRERWLALVTERAAELDWRRRRSAVERVVERQNRISLGLIAVLAVSILLLPLTGANGVIAGLAALYVGALVSSLVTAVRIRTLERRGAHGRPADPSRALASRPDLGGEAWVRSIRIMNLSALRLSPRVRAALADELAAARATPGLGGWPGLVLAEALLDDLPAVEDDD